MRQPWAVQAVGRFMAAAMARASPDDLVRLIEDETGLSRQPRMVYDWKNKGNPDAVIVFALARRLDLSLDEFVRQEPAGAALEGRVRELEAKVSVMADRLGELLDDAGAAPLEFPGA